MLSCSANAKRELGAKRRSDVVEHTATHGRGASGRYDGALRCAEYLSGQGPSLGGLEMCQLEFLWSLDLTANWEIAWSR
jgi:hypothetical protein